MTSAGLSTRVGAWRIGWRLTSASADDPELGLFLDAVRRRAACDGAPVEHELMLQGAVR